MYIGLNDGPLAQLVEHLTFNQVVGGSIPPWLTKFGEVAQLVEQWTENPRVGGSIPPLTTIFLLFIF